MPELSLIQQIAVAALPILLAITLHEVAHGWAALYLGDPTARDAGRLSLNPLRHVDPVGTVLVPAALFLASRLLTGGGFLFGWARPVPVNFMRLRSPRRHMALVALAGPAANLLMLVAWAWLARLALTLANQGSDWVALPLWHMATIGISINALLAVINLVPVPPLDGGRVAVGLLPRPAAMWLARLEPFGLFIMLGLLASGLLGQIVGPVLRTVSRLGAALAGF